jgi:hypothetical protein
MSEKPEAWTAIDSFVWPHIAANLIREHRAENERLEAENDALRRDAERLQGVVDSIYVYANDTLSGPANGPDDRKFHREGIVEIRNRARQLSSIGFAAAARAAIEARRRDAEALERGTAAIDAAMEPATEPAIRARGEVPR